MKGLFTLTPFESKRLIAKAIPHLPSVRNALSRGTIIVANGTTNAFVAEELGKITVASKALYSVGIITGGKLTANPPEKVMPPLVIKHGTRVEIPWRDVLPEFGPHDVFIKGGNALDLDGFVGILTGDGYGGTIGRALPVISSRGSTLVVPIGLEKLVPSVVEAAGLMGSQTFDWAIGGTAGMMVVTNAEVVTEIEAINLLSGAQATCVASGGVAGSEGAVTLVVQGDNEQVTEIKRIVESIKGEPQVV